MPSIPLVALKGFAYHRTRLTKGDAFEALTASDAKVLRLAGMARDAAAAKLPGPSTSEGPRPDDRLPEPAAEQDGQEDGQDDLPADDDADDESSPDPLDAGPTGSPSPPRRRRGRPKKYQTAALTPHDK